jgi:hypothetical protein
MTKLLMVWMVAAGVAAAATCAAWITHVVDQIKLADDSWATGRYLVCGPSIPYGVLPAVAKSNTTVTIGANGSVDFCLAGGAGWFGVRLGVGVDFR